MGSLKQTYKPKAENVVKLKTFFSRVYNKNLKK